MKKVTIALVFGIITTQLYAQTEKTPADVVQPGKNFQIAPPPLPPLPPPPPVPDDEIPTPPAPPTPPPPTLLPGKEFLSTAPAAETAPAAPRAPEPPIPAKQK